MFKIYSYSFILLLISMTLQLSCEKKTVGQTTEFDGTTYRGLLPCANCEARLYQLDFKDNRKFTVSLMYIGKSNKLFKKSGQWEVIDDSLIVLKRKQTKIRKILIGKRNLLLLNKDGRIPEGQTAGMYRLHKENEDMPKEQWKEKVEQGIDFKSTGNEPFWMMEIDFEGNIMFKTMNGDSVSVPVPKMELKKETKTRVLNTDSAGLSAGYSPVGCINSMSGLVHGYSVRVNYGDTEYIGCGDMISRDHQLIDYWRPVSIAGNTIESLEKKAWLKVHTTKDSISGFTGCNYFSAALKIDKEKVKATNMTITQMACPDSIGSEFVKAMEMTSTYNYKNQTLKFLNEEDTLMILRRY